MDRLRFLLDTNILSEPTKRPPEPNRLTLVTRNVADFEHFGRRFAGGTGQPTEASTSSPC